MIEGKVNADILVIGSSRALVQFDPAIIEKITNRSSYVIGLNGSMINVQFPVLKTYLNHNKTPEMIVQVLGITELEYGEVHEPYQYLPYLKEKELYESLKSIDPEFIRYKYVPLYGFLMLKNELYEPIFYGLLNKDDDTRAKRTKGFYTDSRGWDDSFEKFKKEYPKGRSLKISQVNLDDLKELINICKDKGIKLVIVFPPAYYESYKYFTNLPDTFKIYSDLALNNNIQFLNYADSEISKSTENFYNSQHMNTKGATKFSTILAEDLKKVLR